MNAVIRSAHIVDLQGCSRVLFPLLLSTYDSKKSLLPPTESLCYAWKILSPDDIPGWLLASVLRPYEKKLLGSKSLF